MSSSESCGSLSAIAWELRLQALRMIYRARSGHPGGSFSAAEILTALYFHQARLDPSRPDWEERDRIFVSKGHCAPIYYAALARAGFFPEQELDGFRQLGSRLQGHPDRNKLPGVEMSSGPLGLGASVAVGCALGLRQRKLPSRVFCLLGDGELQEGIVWEAALCAAKYGLDNLTFLVDSNGFQLSGSVSQIMPLEPLADKWRSFGWQTLAVDGHSLPELLRALDETKPEKRAGKPAVILAQTVKGKGVSFMEGSSAWHGRAPNAEQMAAAEAELMGRLNEIRQGRA